MSESPHEQEQEQEHEHEHEHESDLRPKLEEARQTIAHMKRRERIDQLLTDAEAVDLDATRMLTEQAVRRMSEPDVDLAVADLRRHKPHLFPPRGRSASGAMAPRSEPETVEAEDLAQRARLSHSRRDLLWYLRRKRGPGH